MSVHYGGRGPGHLSRKTATSAFSPLSLSPAVWLDPSDLSTMFQSGTRASPGTPVSADGDPVGLILDKSGNAHDLTASGTARPLYKTGGYLLFDGVDDILSATFTINQPIDRVSAIQQVSWTDGDTIFGGITANGAVLQQSGTSGNVRLFDGTVVTTVAVGTGSNVVITERHQGASSRIAINNGSYTTSNPGANNPGGLSVGNSGFNTTLASNIRFYGLVERGSTFTDAEIALLRTYEGSKCGLTL